MGCHWKKWQDHLWIHRQDQKHPFIHALCRDPVCIRKERSASAEAFRIYWFSDFNWTEAQTALEEYQDTINILLVARSTPKIPLQELWTSRNYQKIQQNKWLVINTWGLFDFIAWAQKRAPKFWRTLKLEWLYRLISDPKRNSQKVINSLAIIPYFFHYVLLGKKVD